MVFNSGKSVVLASIPFLSEPRPGRRHLQVALKACASATSWSPFLVLVESGAASVAGWTLSCS